MPDSVDDLTIINDALARIGGPPVFALDEESSLVRQVLAVYEVRRDALLGMWTWEFAKLTRKLSAVPKTTGNGYNAQHKWGNGYAYAFALPGDRIGTPRKVLDCPTMPDRPLRQFAIEGGRLYANVEDVWATFTVRAHPQIWSPMFRLAVTTLIAADLCVPVSHDVDLARYFREVGEGGPNEQGRGGLVGRAIAADVSGSPGPSPIQTEDDITTAHMR